MRVMDVNEQEDGHQRARNQLKELMSQERVLLPIWSTLINKWMKNGREALKHELGPAANQYSNNIV